MKIYEYDIDLFTLEIYWLKNIFSTYQIAHPITYEWNVFHLPKRIDSWECNLQSLNICFYSFFAANVITYERITEKNIKIDETFTQTSNAMCKDKCL